MYNPPEQASAPENYAVLIEARTGRQTSILIDQVRIGRSKDNEIVLTGDLTVSRRQARIFRLNGEYFLEDLGSTNGTLLNGQQVKGRIKLRHDDVINIGRTTFLFSRAINMAPDDEVPTEVVGSRGIVEIVRGFFRTVSAAVDSFMPADSSAFQRNRALERSCSCDLSHRETVEPEHRFARGKLLHQALKQYQKRKEMSLGISPSQLASRK